MAVLAGQRAAAGRLSGVSRICSSWPGSTSTRDVQGKRSVASTRTLCLPASRVRRDEGRDAEVGVVDRHARAVRVGGDLDLPGLDARRNSSLDASWTALMRFSTPPSTSRKTRLSTRPSWTLFRFRLNRYLLAAGADAAGDDAAHAQRHAGAAQAGDVVQAGLGAALALDAEAGAELFLARDLESAVLGGVGDDHLGQVVGELGVLVGRGEDQHRDLFAGARAGAARRAGQPRRAAARRRGTSR